MSVSFLFMRLDYRKAGAENISQLLLTLRGEV